MSRITVLPKSLEAEYRNQTLSHGSPLLILDCDVVAKQYKNLLEALPGVDLYYAIKSLPHTAAIEKLNSLGACFDIASSGEIELLREKAVFPRDTIHTHPIKKESDIKDALRFGCTTFVIDNIYELEKFVKFKSRVGILIRVSFPNPDAPVDLSKKFGCKVDEVSLLIRKAKSLGINIKGLSFHAGSQSPNAKTHVYAIDECRKIIENEYSENGKILSILDIGGGFPVRYTGESDGFKELDIKEFCAPINKALQKLPDFVNIIAEPGRYISAPSMLSIATITGKAKRGDRVWYYLDDGVYGSFSGQIYDHATYPLSIFSDSTKEKYFQLSTIAGPTCDNIDVIAEDVMLPNLEIGDIIIGMQMGAYTSASATDFNLIKRAKTIVVNAPENLSNVISVFPTVSK